ncbi:MAG: glycine oxidase ThiO [Gaiellaceae bacterium]
MTQAERFDAVIVGGGVIGLASAWRALQAGLRICVVERDVPASGATRVAAGLLTPDTEVEPGREPFVPLAQASAGLYPEFVAELEEASGLQVGYERSGTVFAALDRDEVDVVRREYELQRRLGLDSRWLTASECRALEPGLSPACTGGLHAPHEAQVDPRRVAAALSVALAAGGCTLLAPEEVVGGSREGGRLCGVVTRSGKSVQAERVVLAGGAWSGLSALAADPLPVRPVKGQVLRLQARQGERPAVRIVRTEHVYVVPRSDGEVVVGATMEEQSFDARVTAGAVHELLREAYRALPEIAELELVETAVGFRPATPDNGPLIGEWGDEGLLVATGHYRNGILLAPVTAAAVAALLTGAPPPPGVAAFEPGRFALEAVR